jgi:hypothetical protein
MLGQLRQRRTAYSIFLESEAKVSASSQAMMTSGGSFHHSQIVPRKGTEQHIAPYVRFTEAKMAFLRNKHNAYAKDTYNQMQLSWVGGNGYEAAVGTRRYQVF